VGVPASHIVAVTFTNKAAHEMMDRIGALLGLPDLSPWNGTAPRLGTFHGFCLRLLREEAGRLGYRPGFVVYDRDDSLGLLKTCIKELHLDDKVYPPPLVLRRMAEAKDRQLSPHDFLEQAGDADTEAVGQIYASYQKRLLLANAMDFDDLIWQTLVLFRNHPERLTHNAGRCRHLLVDEFQDTNASQYRLVRALSSVHGNIFVVGDEDQSIYRFRGADITNILNFEKDYPEATLVRLEHNYRSTQTILAAAGAVVANNSQRLGKNLFTKNPAGEPIRVFRAATERDESDWVVEQIRRLRDDHDIPLENQAVLYRANFQSRPFEDRLARSRFPYTIVGSVGFYERREVRDLLSYLRFLHNPADDMALRRVINTPSRGLGRTSVEKLEQVAAVNDLCLADAARMAVKENILSTRPQASLARFLKTMDEIRSGMKGQPISRLIEDVMNLTEYLPYLKKAEPVSFDNRVDNLQELARAADEGERDEGGLQAFLDRTALTSQADSAAGDGGVFLMTVHCAKGLEFDAVYMVGLEERLFPHGRSSETAADLEEERRLFYVGVTRARQRLAFSHASMRMVYGQLQVTEPSRFLSEIPEDLMQEESSDYSSYPSLRRGPERRKWQPAAGKPRSWSRRGGQSSGAVVDVRGRGAGGNVTVEYDGSGLPEAAPAELRVGMQVLHGRYGRGTVLKREGSGPRLKVTVSFPGLGPKKLMVRYAGLRVL
ncbi:MAG: ATP-dependent helicase, partial [Acidobacteriota bacterium]